MLAGRLPFEAATWPALVQAHLYAAPTPITELNPTLPAAVEAALTKALAKDPAQRFATAAELGAAIKQGDWNDYVIIAQGNHLQQFVSGKQTVDVTDEDPAKQALSGILALQLHAGPPMMVQFKNIRIKKL